MAEDDININLQQTEIMVQCYQCDFSAPEATYDQTEEYIRLHRFKSIQTNEFEYICSNCINSINGNNAVWIKEEKTNFLKIGQFVLAEVDEKEGEKEEEEGEEEEEEEEEEFNNGWFSAIVWKIDNKKRECEIEFQDKSKGTAKKNFDDIKILEAFGYCSSGQVYKHPLMCYYENYAHYAKKHNLFPKFDFVQVEDDQISEELNASISQNLGDIFVAKKALKSKETSKISKNDISNENSTTNIASDNFDENKSTSKNLKKEKKIQRQIACIKKISKKKKHVLINPWKFCYVKGQTVLKIGQPGSTVFIQPESKRRKRYKELEDNPVENFYPLNYCFFDIRMKLSKYLRIATNFFIDKNNQVIIEDYISGLTPRKNYTKLYCDIGKIFSYFVPLFGKCLQKIYEKHNVRYLQELRDLNGSEPPEKRQKLMMEQSCLTGRKMQVFVEAVDYKIQPGEKFQGKWKIEGLQQENIAAIGIYCCEISEDLSDFGLEFRRGINDDETHKLYVSHLFSNLPFDTNNAEIILGSINIKKNRCIVFPNDVQHRIIEFSQKNQERVKNCKILYFFLVDPELEIVSSADIQNQNWEENKVQILMELQKIAKRILGQSFSQEVVQKILQGAKTGFSHEEELVHRKVAIKMAQRYNKRIKDITTRSFRDEVSTW